MLIIKFSYKLRYFVYKGATFEITWYCMHISIKRSSHAHQSLSMYTYPLPE